MLGCRVAAPAERLAEPDESPAAVFPPADVATLATTLEFFWLNSHKNRKSLYRGNR